jgi:hypothetical protein
MRARATVDEPGKVWRLTHSRERPSPSGLVGRLAKDRAGRCHFDTATGSMTGMVAVANAKGTTWWVNRRGGMAPHRPSDGSHGHDSHLARGTVVSHSNAAHMWSSSAVQRQRHVAKQTRQAGAGRRGHASGQCRPECGIACTRLGQTW